MVEDRTMRQAMDDQKGKESKHRKKKPEDNKESSFLNSSIHIVEMVYDLPESKFIKYDKEKGDVEEIKEFEGFHPYNSDLINKGVILFPTAVGEYENERKLIDEIQAFIHRYVDVSPFFEKLSAYYVMFTWLYDNFNTLPYLRVLGDYGTGKTRFLQTVGSICYKPMFAGGATTPSPVFRIIEMFKGTLVLDEADFKASEDWADIIKILNCGFQAGFPVLRTEETNGKREPHAYDCYCPKILATRREFKDKALESRCLTEKLMETDRDDIPLLLDKDFYKNTQELRNKLLSFRFAHYEKHEIDLTQQDNTIEKRLSQVIISIYSIIDDPKIREEIGVFLKEYNKKLIADRGEQYEAIVLEELFNITSNRVGDGRRKEKLYMKTVLDSLNIKAETDKERMSSQKLSWIIKKKLLLDLVKDRNGRWIIWDIGRFFKLIKKYGICDDVTSVTTYRGAPPQSSHNESPRVEQLTVKLEEEKCDELGVHPVGSSQSSLRHTKEEEQHDQKKDENAKKQAR